MRGNWPKSFLDVYRTDMPPSISLIIPTYNRASLVARAVESALAQQSAELEILVVDDGSTDDTLAVLDGYGDRIRVVTQVNGGVEKARNFGVEQASGDYIWFLDSDDKLLPGALAAVLAGMKQYPAVDVLYGWAQIIDAAGHRAQWSRPTANGRVWPQYLYSNPTPVGTFIVKHICAARFPFNSILYEDWHFLLRLSFQVDFRCIRVCLVEIEYQPIRRSTDYEPDEVLRAARLMYSRLLSDPISGPLLQPYRNYLDANAYVMLGHQYRVMLNDRVAARQAFLNAIRCMPTFRRAYVGLAQSLLSASAIRLLRIWRDRWFTNINP